MIVVVFKLECFFIKKILFLFLINFRLLYFQNLNFVNFLYVHLFFLYQCVRFALSEHIELSATENMNFVWTFFCLREMHTCFFAFNIVFCNSFMKEKESINILCVTEQLVGETNQYVTIFLLRRAENNSFSCLSNLNLTKKVCIQCIFWCFYIGWTCCFLKFELPNLLHEHKNWHYKTNMENKHDKKLFFNSV